MQDHPALKLNYTDEIWIRKGTRVNPGKASEILRMDF